MEETAPDPELKLRIVVNSDVKMSRGKYAAQAVHAALLAVGAHPGTPVIVIGGKRTDIEQMRTVVHDAGRTEVEPGTVTAGTDWELPLESFPLTVEQMLRLHQIVRTQVLSELESEGMTRRALDPRRNSPMLEPVRCRVNAPDGNSFDGWFFGYSASGFARVKKQLHYKSCTRYAPSFVEVLSE